VVLGPLSAHGERLDGTSRALCALGWLLAALFVTTSAGAQYRFAAWTADNGLPQNIIRGMHQTSDEYFWIATLDGVARFDGVHFTSSTKAIRPELPLTAPVQWWEDWAVTCGSCPEMALSRGTTTAPSKLRKGAGTSGGQSRPGMVERSSLLGGRLKMRSDPASGTVMTVEISLVGTNHAE
jgi:hypothetical protein